MLEYLDGHTLADRLKKGPLPVAQALELGAQIADALGAAHKAGIIHRDLKPANVMLTKAPAGANGPSGLHATLLDFGLAKLRAHGEQPLVASPGPSASASLTARGEILGTWPYMAPEQVEGKPADARTDIWALGAVLYEMLTGARAFVGDTAASVVGAILEREPEPLTVRQPQTPPALDRLVRKCLARDPDARWQDACDVADELRWIRQCPPFRAVSRARPGLPGLRVAGSMAAVGLVGAVLGAGAFSVFRTASPAPARVIRSWIPVRPAGEVSGGGGGWLPTPGGSRAAFAWTPDGRALAFVGWRAATAAEPVLPADAESMRGLASQVYIRELDCEDARPLLGTEGATGPVAVSSDGLAVAFWRNSAIHRVALAGGPVTVLAEPVPRVPARIAWGHTGRIVFDGNLDGALWQSTGHGPPSPLTKLRSGELLHGLPQLIDDDRVLLYTIRPDLSVWGEETVVAEELSTGERTSIVQGADGRVLPTGHLVFLRRGVLWAAPFDTSRRALAGNPVGIQESVAQALVADNPINQTGVGHFDVSSIGTLAYMPGTVPSFPDSTLVRISRHGRRTALTAPRRPYFAYVRRAPRVPFLFIEELTLTEHSVWLHDLSQPGSLSRVLRSVEPPFASTPDGLGIVYNSLRNGVATLLWQRTLDAPPETIGRGPLYPVSWSPDGRHLLLAGEDRIWMYTVNGSEPRLRCLTNAGDREEAPEVSPDGRWLAFVSLETGRREVYVRPFPGPGSKTQVSVDTGSSPAWNPRGGELFFVSRSCPAGPSCLKAVSLDFTHGPRRSAAQPLFDFANMTLGMSCSPARCYEVADDGAAFYAVQVLQPPGPRPVVTHINLIQNWFEDLKAKVAAGSR